MSSRAKEFDAIIFGATGYTGQYVIEELAKCTTNSNFKWAVAGRTAEKVRASLEAVQQYLESDIDILQIPVIVADVNDESSISEMCKKTKLVFNCVGPYKMYGEVVVAACIENGTHHVDLSGEMEYLETTQANYFDLAKDKGVYIVQTCGFDSIPVELGITLLKQKFEGDLNSVETYIEFFEGPEGKVLNSGTWLSAVHSARDLLKAGKYTAMLKKVFPKEMPVRHYPLRRKFLLSYSNVVHGWCIWFIGPDDRVVQRTQLINYNLFGERPIEAVEYLKTNSLPAALAFIIGIMYFGLMSAFSFGRYLLGKYPKFFSIGMFSHEGPTRKQVEETSTKFTLCGKGWSDKSAEPSDRHLEAPDKELKLEVTGPEPAYALTSICMVHSGLTILEESDKMPLSGGVFTPGTAFPKTSLRSRLEKRGISFRFQD